jgi:hypothetical protein
LVLRRKGLSEARQCTTTESVGKFADGKVIENLTVTVSPEGKTLTRVAKVKGPDGKFTLKSVYPKQ